MSISAAIDNCFVSSPERLQQLLSYSLQPLQLLYNYVVNIGHLPSGQLPPNQYGGLPP